MDLFPSTEPIGARVDWDRCFLLRIKRDPIEIGRDLLGANTSASWLLFLSETRSSRPFAAYPGTFATYMTHSPIQQVALRPNAHNLTPSPLSVCSHLLCGSSVLGYQLNSNELMTRKSLPLPAFAESVIKVSATPEPLILPFASRQQHGNPLGTRARCCTRGGVYETGLQISVEFWTRPWLSGNSH